MAVKGIVFDIQRFSVHDGPGIRTNIFLKGCPLHCEWCCNPESQKRYPHPMYTAEKCIGCGQCAQVCPKNAILIPTENSGEGKDAKEARADQKNGSYRIDLEKCASCEEHPCVKACFARALTLAGTPYEPDEIIRIIRRDSQFYSSSHGGATFTGGECLTQIDFLEETLAKCKEQGIDTAIETCSACSWENMRRTIPFVNTYLCDVKHVDPEKLREATGADAQLILDNIRRLVEAGANVIGRIPVIPGFNSDPEEIRAIGEFLLSVGIRTVHLLPFHRLGEPKYDKIFSPHRPMKRETLSEQDIQSLQKVLEGIGLNASVGG